MHRLPEQDIYVYKTPGEEVHKILMADIDGKKLKAFSKIDTTNDSLSYKIFSEDAHKNIETLAEGTGSAQDFDNEVQRVGREYLEPIGESWREVQPKYMSNFDPKNPCPKH